jgi:hypothetical protein
MPKNSDASAGMPTKIFFGFSRDEIHVRLADANR